MKRSSKVGVRKVQEEEAVPRQGQARKVAGVYYLETLASGSSSDLATSPRVASIEVLTDPNGVIWGVEVAYIDADPNTVLVGNIKNIRWKR